MNLITASLEYLIEESFPNAKKIKEIMHEVLETKDITYHETINDIALRGSIEPHMIPIMQKFLTERFSAPYLEQIFNANAEKKEMFVFINTNQQNFIKFNLDEITVFVGDINFLHTEISALTNALGLVLTQRDNFPGGKQKLAFTLVDQSWSALQSKLPFIIYS